MSSLRGRFLGRYWVVVLGVVVCFGVAVGYCGTATVSYQVSASADDGFAWSSTEQDVNSGYVMIGDGRDYSAPYHMSAMRFANVGIPRSATIVDAHLKIKSLDEGIRGQIYGVIQAEATDDAADFSSRYIADVNKTLAAVDWDHKFNWDVNTWYTSPNVPDAVQEVVNRAGWSAGNSLAIYYCTRADSDKTRMFGSFEAGSPAELEITYDVYVISGHVRFSDGNGVSGVLVSAGSDIEDTVTDANGYYQLFVPPGWSGDVMAVKGGWGFDPFTRTYSSVTSDQLNRDYEARPDLYGGGFGTEEDPYEIYTPEQMQTIGANANDWHKHFKLMADIDLGDYNGVGGNPPFKRIGHSTTVFAGVFDGNGHTISNFSCDSTVTDHIGLFGYVSDHNAMIGDLGLIDPNIEAGTGERVGSLVGRLGFGSIVGCYVQGGKISGYYGVGGLVGENYSGQISNSYSSANVTGEERVGGLVGLDNYGGGYILDSYATGAVSGTSYVGGLVGYSDLSGEISGCHASGDVLGISYIGGLVGASSHMSISRSYSASTVTGDEKVGGLVGANHFGTISTSYFIGDISGANNIGGLVGHARCIISDSYSLGSVSGIYKVGSLVGYNEYGSISNSYAAGTVSGTDDVGGLVGYGGGAVQISYWDIETTGQAASVLGVGLTTTQMQAASTFELWGRCGNEVVWTIDEGDYPHLWFENHPGESLAAANLSDYIIGTGTEAEPYLIYTGEELNLVGLFNCEWNKHFRLMADIDLSSFTKMEFSIIGTETVPFRGVFDGNDYSIHNFSYDASDGLIWDVGLFGYVDDPNAEIKDVGLIDPNIRSGGGCVGSLVGNLYEGDVTGCYVANGRVSAGQYLGGLVGYIRNGTISDSHWDGDVLGGGRVGGLVGYNLSGIIVNTYSMGNISGGRVGGLVGENHSFIYDSHFIGNVYGGGNAGGLVGVLENGYISDAYSIAEVSGTGGLGGLVGAKHFSTTTRCYSVSNVSGTSSVGGLIGTNHEGWITLSYSTGSVYGEYKVGGLVGHTNGRIQNTYSRCSVSGIERVGGLLGYNDYNGSQLGMNYSTGSVSGTTYVGGLVGLSDPFVRTSYWDIETSGQVSSDGGTGLTTAEMHTASGFVGFDFVNTWTICEGTNYPKFVWQIPVADFVCPDGVTLPDFSILASAWMTDPNQLNWNPVCDISDPNDNFINELDLRVFSENYLTGF